MIINKIKGFFRRVLDSDTFLFLTNFFESDKKNYFYFLFLPLTVVVVLIVINKWWIISLFLIFFVYLLFANSEKIEDFVEDLRVHKSNQKLERFTKFIETDYMTLFGVNIKLEKLLGSIKHLEKMIHRVYNENSESQNLLEVKISLFELFLLAEFYSGQIIKSDNGTYYFFSVDNKNISENEDDYFLEEKDCFYRKYESKYDLRKLVSMIEDFKIRVYEKNNTLDARTLFHLVRNNIINTKISSELSVIYLKRKKCSLCVSKTIDPIYYQKGYIFKTLDNKLFNIENNIPRELKKLIDKDKNMQADLISPVREISSEDTNAKRIELLKAHIGAGGKISIIENAKAKILGKSTVKFFYNSHNIKFEINMLSLNEMLRNDTLCSTDAEVFKTDYEAYTSIEKKMGRDRQHAKITHVKNIDDGLVDEGFTETFKTAGKAANINNGRSKSKSTLNKTEAYVDNSITPQKKEKKEKRKDDIGTIINETKSLKYEEKLVYVFETIDDIFENIKNGYKFWSTFFSQDKKFIKNTNNELFLDVVSLLNFLDGLFTNKEAINKKLFYTGTFSENEFIDIMQRLSEFSKGLFKTSNKIVKILIKKENKFFYIDVIQIETSDFDAFPREKNCVTEEFVDSRTAEDVRYKTIGGKNFKRPEFAKQSHYLNIGD